MTDPRQGASKGVSSSLLQARRLMEDRGALEALLRSPKAQQLAQQLRQQPGDDLQKVAEAAERGDTAPLQALFQSLLRGQKDSSGR